MSESTMEKEIIKAYEEGWSQTKIQKEFDISYFQLAYILGKHKITPRLSKVGFGPYGANTMIVQKGLRTMVPTRIVKQLNLKARDLIHYDVVANPMTLQEGEKILKVTVVGHEEGKKKGQDSSKA